MKEKNLDNSGISIILNKKMVENLLKNNNMKSVCLISGASPEFLGGTSLYQINLINHAKENKLNLNFTWIYPGKEIKKLSLEKWGKKYFKELLK